VREILPNALPLVVNASLTIGTAILFEAGQSFLGLVRPQRHELGVHDRQLAPLSARGVMDGHPARPRDPRGRAEPSPASAIGSTTW
jgi:hypothetical protein